MTEITMTKEDLEFVRDNHEVSKNSYDDHATCGYNYEDGYVDALNFVLEHLDKLCEDVHQDKLMQRATEKAKYYIRKYFQNKYGCDDEGFKDEIEDLIRQALDEGDAETIANSFIDSADDGIPDDDWCETIVRDFYD